MCSLQCTLGDTPRTLSPFTSSCTLEGVRELSHLSLPLHSLHPVHSLHSSHAQESFLKEKALEQGDNKLCTCTRAAPWLGHVGVRLKCREQEPLQRACKMRRVTVHLSQCQGFVLLVGLGPPISQMMMRADETVQLTVASTYKRKSRFHSKSVV